MNSTHEIAIADLLRPFQGIVGDVCYTAIGEGEGEKVKGLFLKFDGLLPSCLSPPPLPLAGLFSFVCLAVLGLSCGTQDLRSLLRHAGSLAAAYELLLVLCGT